MSKIYCGIGKVPKGMKIGSVKQCIDKGQIRMYGLKKVEAKLLEKLLLDKKKNKGRSRTSLMKKMGALKGKIRKIKMIIEYDKNKKKIENAKIELKKYQKEVNEVIKKIEQT